MTTSTDRRYGAESGKAIKAPCVVATTANITLLGEQTIEGVAVVSGNRVLVAAQTDPTENGIWIANTSAWTRAPDWDGNRDVTDGTLVTIARGVGRNPTYQANATNPVVIGTSSVTFTRMDGASVSYAITDAEIAHGLTVNDIDDSYEPGDIKRYQSNDTPATTDMLVGFQAMIGQNEQDGGAAMLTHQESYYLSAGITWCAGGEDDKTWMSYGSLLTTDQDVELVKIGPLGSSIQARNLSLLGCLQVLQTGSSTKAGVLFGQVYESELHIASDGFKYLNEIRTDESGFSYNEVYYRFMNTADYGVFLNATSNGWVNENNFHGGRFAGLTGTLTRHIHIPKGTGIYPQPNNNRFHGPSLECAPGCTMEDFYHDNGISNSLLEPRQENNGTLNDIPLILGVDSLACKITNPYLGFAGRELDLESAVSRGLYNRIEADDKIQWSPRCQGRATTSIEINRVYANNSGVPMQRLYDGYTGSQDAMTYASGVYRQTAAGYHFRGVQLTSIVTGADGHDYLCILDHTSAADDEPGVGVNWETYWEPLGSSNADGAAWVVTTAYTQPVTQFMVDSTGKIRTNQLVANVNTPSGATAYAEPKYNEDGTLRGYTPVYAAQW